MERFDRVLTKIENTLAAASLGFAAALAIVSVILRYTVDYIIFWGEEAIVYSIIFSTFIGAVITLRHNEHVNVDILSLFFGRRGRRALAFAGALVALVYCAVIGGFAWVLVAEPYTHNILTPALKLPLWVVYISLPIGLTLMFVRLLEILYRTARGRQTFPEAEEDEFQEEAAR
ncbi:TRAP transporter small permease [soil metagenome]